MGFRDKTKALFRTKTRSSDSESLSKTSSQERWPSNVYKPGETMPRPKYRQPPKKDHTDKLEAFSFADAWRRKSTQSQYSPMGTRAPSRRNSFLSIGRKKSASSTRSKSITSADTEKSSSKRREWPKEGGHGAALAPTLTAETENPEGDDDVANVGLSRVNSQNRTNPRTKPPATTTTTTDAPGNISPRPKDSGIITNGMAPDTMGTAHDHAPFTEHDLELALKRSHLAVPAQ